MIKSGDGRIVNKLKIRIAEKETRDGRRYTYRDINEITGISTSTLTDWMSGKVKLIATDTLIALCSFLECQPGDLIEYVRDKSKMTKRLQ